MNFWWIFIIGHYIKFIKSQASIKRKVLSTCQFSSIYIGFAAIYHHLPHLGTSPDQDFWGIMFFLLRIVKIHHDLMSHRHWMFNSYKESKGNLNGFVMANPKVSKDIPSNSVTSAELHSESQF